MRLRIFASFLTLALVSSAYAQGPVAGLVYGPASVPLRDEAILGLPQAMVFAPRDQAEKWLRQAGNFPGAGLVGIVVPNDQSGEGWAVVVDYETSGFVKENESREIDPDKLLAGLKQSNEAQNRTRREAGKPPLDVLGWIEPPHYDAATHHLIWSVEVRHPGADPDGETSVNYNTRVLGRDGYFSLDLVTKRRLVETDKPAIDALLAGLRYDEGKRYEDYDAKTDKTAEYGLIALIGGIAAHKIGLFAVIAAFAAKFIKLWIIAAAGGLAALRNLLKRRKRQ